MNHRLYAIRTKRHTAQIQLSSSLFKTGHMLDIWDTYPPNTSNVSV